MSQTYNSCREKKGTKTYIIFLIHIPQNIFVMFYLVRATDCCPVCLRSSAAVALDVLYFLCDLKEELHSCIVCPRPTSSASSWTGSHLRLWPPSRGPLFDGIYAPALQLRQCSYTHTKTDVHCHTITKCRHTQAAHHSIDTFTRSAMVCAR